MLYGENCFEVNGPHDGIRQVNMIARLSTDSKVRPLDRPSALVRCNPTVESLQPQRQIQYAAHHRDYSHISLQSGARDADMIAALISEALE